LVTVEEGLDDWGSVYTEKKVSDFPIASRKNRKPFLQCRVVMSSKLLMARIYIGWCAFTLAGAYLN